MDQDSFTDLDSPDQHAMPSPGVLDISEMSKFHFPDSPLRLNTRRQEFIMNLMGLSDPPIENIEHEDVNVVGDKDYGEYPVFINPSPVKIERRNSVSSWSEEPQHKTHSHPTISPKGDIQTADVSRAQRPASATTRPASASRFKRPTSATTPSSQRLSSGSTGRTLAARTSTSSGTHQRPTSARPLGHDKKGDESEFLSSADIVASRYYAGLGESGARNRLIAGDSLKDRERDMSQSLPTRDYGPSAPLPGWTPSRIHLRSQPRFQDYLVESPTGYQALRIPGYSQRLIQTEKPPQKCLLQKVLERGGGSALSFDTQGETDIDRHFEKNRSTGKGRDRDVQSNRGGFRCQGPGVMKMGSRTATTLLPEPTDREARVKADIMSPRYPYYKDRNKGKERDGEHVGFSIMPLRAPGVKTRLFETFTDKHDQLLPTSEGPAHGGSKGKSKIEFRTEFRPHSPQARNDTWLYDDDLPPEKKKKGALTIAELDRQLRLLEIQARAAEMGGPPLKIGAERDLHIPDTESDTLTRGRSAMGGSRKLQLRWGGDTPVARSVGAQSSRGSLGLHAKGFAAGALESDALESDVPPFKVWSFQGKYQSFRRAEAEILTLADELAGEAGKEVDILEPRFTPRKSLSQAPSHCVLKGTGGPPTFVNTRYADQSIYLRGKSMFNHEEEIGNFLTAKDIALIREEKKPHDVALAAEIEAQDELGQSLKDRMVEPSLLQQMEQHCHIVRKFMCTLLDEMEGEGYHTATDFIRMWQGDDTIIPDGEGGLTSWRPPLSIMNASHARVVICKEVWVSMTEQNASVQPGVLSRFIPDFIPENMKYDDHQAVISLLKLVLDRSGGFLDNWWEKDQVVKEFNHRFPEAAEKVYYDQGTWNAGVFSLENIPEIQFEMNCRMKKEILVRALVIPSYLLAVMTSDLWNLPPLNVDTAEEKNVWLKTCLLLRMYFFECHLDPDHNKWPSIQDASWSDQEVARKASSPLSGHSPLAPARGGVKRTLSTNFKEEDEYLLSPLPPGFHYNRCDVDFDEGSKMQVRFEDHTQEQTLSDGGGNSTSFASPLASGQASPMATSLPIERASSGNGFQRATREVDRE